MTMTTVSGLRTPRKPNRVLPHVFLGALIVYFLVPLWWMIINSSKDTQGLFGGTSGSLWFDQNINYLGNLHDLFSYNGGIYLQWVANSALYAISGGVGATVVAVLAGYGFAKFRFRGRNFTFALLLGSVMVPLTALVIPTFIMLSQVQLWSLIIIGSLVSVIPLIIAFLSLQKYWQGGLSLGSLK